MKQYLPRSFSTPRLTNMAAKEKPCLQTLWPVLVRQLIQYKVIEVSCPVIEGCLGLTCGELAIGTRLILWKVPPHNWTNQNTLARTKRNRKERDLVKDLISSKFLNTNEKNRMSTISQHTPTQRFHYQTETCCDFTRMILAMNNFDLCSMHLINVALPELISNEKCTEDRVGLLRNGAIKPFWFSMEFLN